MIFELARRLKPSGYFVLKKKKYIKKYSSINPSEDCLQIFLPSITRIQYIEKYKTGNSFHGRKHFQSFAFVTGSD